jgi:uncharacterized protein (DUF488 family)
MKRIFTIGHSTHPLDEFVNILAAHEIKAIADVRRFPGSRKYPHFNDVSLRVELPKRGIAYHPFLELGGRRRARADSVNTAWRNASFRGYADYMQTPEFVEALSDLEKQATRRATAIMCAEAFPLRCHRSLIADALLIRGWEVVDIMSATSAPPHKLTKFALVTGDRITYPETADPSLFPPAHDISPHSA